MAETVEEKARIDKQGRVVIPARIRRSLGLQDGGEVIVRLDGSRIVLEPVSEDLEKRVEEWASFALNLSVEAHPEGFEKDWRWMSSEYAKRKLGLP